MLCTPQQHTKYILPHPSHNIPNKVVTYLARGLAGQEDEQRAGKDGPSCLVQKLPDGMGQCQAILHDRCLVHRALDLLAGGLLLGLGVTGLLGIACCCQHVACGQVARQNLGGFLVPLAKVQAVTVVHDGNTVALGKELDLVGDQDGGLVSKDTLDAVLKDVLGGVVVDGREGVVEQHEVAVKVGATGEVETLALATRQVDTTETHHGLVTSLLLWGGVARCEGMAGQKTTLYKNNHNNNNTYLQDLKIQLECACMDHVLVSALLQGLAKQDALLDGQVLAPGVLGHIGDLATDLGLTLVLDHVAKDGLKEGSLTGTDTANHGHQLSWLDGKLRDAQLECVVGVVGEDGVLKVHTRGTGGVLLVDDAASHECLDLACRGNGLGCAAQCLGQDNQGEAQDVEEREQHERGDGGDIGTFHAWPLGSGTSCTEATCIMWWA